MATVEILAARETLAMNKIGDALKSLSEKLGIEFPASPAPSKMDPYHDNVFKVEHFSECIGLIEAKLNPGVEVTEPQQRVELSGEAAVVQEEVESQEELDQEEVQQLVEAEPTSPRRRRR